MVKRQSNKNSGLTFDLHFIALTSEGTFGAIIIIDPFHILFIVHEIIKMSISVPAKRVVDLNLKWTLTMHLFRLTEQHFADLLRASIRYKPAIHQ